MNGASPADNQGEGDPEPGGGWRIGWPGATVLAALCLLAAFALHECSPANQMRNVASITGEAGKTVLKGAERLAEALNQKHVTQTFQEHLESSHADLEGRLLLAEYRAQETFSAADTPWWGIMANTTLGTTTSEIRVPVTYRYYVALNEPWELRVQVTPAGVLCDVLAPPLKPLSNPSPDLSQMEMKSANGWFRGNKEQVQSALLKNITESLNQRAFRHTPEYFAVSREAVEKFVRGWLLKQYGLAPDVPVYMRVSFRNEPPANTRPPVPDAAP